MKKETIKESILNPVSMFIIGLLTGFVAILLHKKSRN